MTFIANMHELFLSKIKKALQLINKSMKSLLEKNAVEMYSTHNEGKSVVAKRFMKTLRNRIY